MKLMNTDLLRQNELWRDEMKHLRNAVNQMETKGYTNLQAFKIHWDHQLYKVLEFQYLIGLSYLSHRLPDIHVDIIFRYGGKRLHIGNNNNNLLFEIGNRKFNFVRRWRRSDQFITLNCDASSNGHCHSKAYPIKAATYSKQWWKCNVQLHSNY